MSHPSLALINFIAPDLTLKSKSTNLLVVVKSSKIITGFSGDALYIPSVSFVYPSINVLPAVNTGVLNESS